jgi:acetolactate synthase I/II/III large subunit
VIEKLYEVTKGDAFVTSDVGQHQMWAAQFYKFDKPRRWINSGGLGTMGFGCRRRWACSWRNPGATVACVTGEASIQMCIQELSTCKQYRLPIKIVNLNNRTWAWCGSGRSSSTATATRSRTWTRCPTS